VLNSKNKAITSASKLLGISETVLMVMLTSRTLRDMKKSDAKDVKVLLDVDKVNYRF
jgi:hypothetical protein